MSAQKWCSSSDVQASLNILRAGRSLRTLSIASNLPLPFLPVTLTPGLLAVSTTPAHVREPESMIAPAAKPCAGKFRFRLRGHLVLDLCAAPGSKSSHIAALAGDEAWVVACDRHPHRLATLRATCGRLGINSIDSLVLDATQTLPFAERAPKFDRVLVDAPCSGTERCEAVPR